MAKTDWKMDDTVMPDDLNQIGQDINALQANGSATDNRIGDRTISDKTAPTGDTGKLTSLLGWLAYMIKAITGKTSWRIAPATNLEAAKTHMDDNTIHITSTERTSWNAKETTTGAQSKADAVQSNLNTHAADTTKHITAAERTTWNGKADKNGVLQTNLNADLLDGYHLSFNSSVNTVMARDSGARVSAATFQSFAGSPAGGAAHLALNTTGLRVGMGLSGLESANNAGADFLVWNYSNEGTFLHEALKITRATGRARFFSEVDAANFVSRVATGTAPITVTSQTLVKNLNADMVDGYHFNQDLKTNASPNFTQVTVGDSNYKAELGRLSLKFDRSGYNYIGAVTAGGSLIFNVNGDNNDYSSAALKLENNYSVKTKNNTLDDGSGNSSFTGNVGVGTTQPSAKLDVNGSIFSRKIMRVIKNSSSTDAFIEFYADPTTSNTRTGWMGFGSDKAVGFNLTNQIGGITLTASGEGNITLNPAGGGSVFAVTPATGDNSTKVSTTQHVTNKLNDKVPMKIYNSLTTPVGASSGDLWFPPPS